METKEIKLCKHCQTEIPKKAKVCPNCRKKQGGIGKWIVIAVVILLIIGATTSDSSDDEPQKVANQTTSELNKTDNNQTEKNNITPTETPKEKTAFYIGETAELKGVQVTMTNFEESTGKDYITPTNENIFALAEFEIVNNTDSELSISSILSFDAYADDYSLNYSLSAAMLKDGQLNGTIAAGKKMKGWIGWEVPEDYKNIEIHFTDNVWKNGKFVFVYEK